MPEKPLRVAQLMRSASRSYAGVFVAARGLSLALARDPNLRLEVFAVKDAHTETDRPQWESIPVHGFPMLPLAAFSYAPRLAKAVQYFQPHIVHQHGLWTYPSLVARRLAKRSRARVIVSVHGMLTPWALQHGARRKRVALWHYERKNLASADCIHALTPIEVDEVRAMRIQTPICVIPNGVETPATTSHKHDRERAPGSRELLYVGRLHAKKGIQELLQGWALYKAGAEGEEWRLKIVGWGEDEFRDKLRAAVAELGIGSSVEFAGPKFGDDLLTAYAQADAFVLTSHSEAMPMTVLEAWEFGLPVIMTPDCGLLEGFDWGAAIRTSVAPQDIAGAIAALVRMPQEARHEMGRTGRALAQERHS